MSDASVIEVSGLWHRYSKDWALKGLDLAVRGTGVIGLLGSNGAGKSTLMNIVCGCLSQTKGTALVDGLDVRAEPLAARRRIGFLPQQAPLSPELTVREYLTFCAGLRGVARAEIADAVGFVAERCGLTGMIDRLIANLSGGYRQRTGIAQALIHQPSVIILDEPTVGLDPNQIVGVRSLIREIAEQHTVIFSTHILPEVESMCRDVIMIEHGHIVFNGDMDAFRRVVTPNSLILVCEAPPDPGAIKNAIPTVERVERLGECKLRIGHGGAGDIVEALIDLGRAGGWGIREVYFEKSSLEDVFAELSKGDGK